MRFGSHVSIATHLYLAIDRAVAVGCEALQIFSGNPRGWKTGPFAPEELTEFKARRAAAGLSPLAIHLPYLVNLCSPSDRVILSSIDSIRNAVGKAVALEADFLVMHIGGHGGDGIQTGLARLAAGLSIVLKEDFGDVKLLLENPSGAGHSVGSTFAEIGQIIAAAGEDNRLGLCFDTCHAFGAGYDLATAAGLKGTLAEIDREIGLDRLLLVHANDSKGALGSHLDRHEQIGKGSIGIEGFRLMIEDPTFKDIAFILETPKKDPADDPRNLTLLRELRAGANR